MGKVRGFLEISRKKPGDRPTAERVHDYKEFVLPLADQDLRDQGARCMDCGIPFCHEGCPLGNHIPDWNDHIFHGRTTDAVAALHATNNFPEVTGRVCPAPCEASCVLNLQGQPVTIKTIERAIADYAAESGFFRPVRPQVRSGKRVAVVGSGPAGLAAAQQLARRGHDVVVYEKADRPGGLLRYGIPDFKLDKGLIDQRLAQLREEGVGFRTGVHVGVDVTGAALREEHDAIVLAMGAEGPRDLEVPGRHLRGVHFAMEFLTQQNRRVAGDAVPAAGAILATGKHVVVLGGGDTGSDCVGTSHRQGARSVRSLELMPRPPEERRPSNPWPEWPLVYRSSSSHEEGGERDFAVMTTEVLADGAGAARALRCVRVSLEGGRIAALPGSEHEVPAELVLLAMGFLGPVRGPIFDQLGCALDARGNVAAKQGRTSVPGVFAAGDVARGQSLVVWAIAEGRKVAAAVDAWLAAPAAIWAA